MRRGRTSWISRTGTWSSSSSARGPGTGRISSLEISHDDLLHGPLRDVDDLVVALGGGRLEIKKAVLRPVSNRPPDERLAVQEGHAHALAEPRRAWSEVLLLLPPAITRERTDEEDRLDLREGNEPLLSLESLHQHLHLMVEEEPRVALQKGVIDEVDDDS